MVVGVSGVGTHTNRTQTAELAANVRGSLTRHQYLLCGCATGYAGWHQVGELLRQACKARNCASPNERVSINRLEQIGPAVSGIARFKRRVLANLALKAKAPAVNAVGAEVRRNRALVKSPGIEYPRCNDRLQLRTHIGASRDGQQRGCS